MSNKFIWGYAGYGSGSSTDLYMWRLNQSFNLTNYNYIKVVECGTNWQEHYDPDFSDTTLHKDGYVCVGVATSAMSSVNTPSSSTGTPSGMTAYSYGNGTVILNVSSLSGNYWIYFGGIISQGTKYRANGLNQIFVSTS